jgi:hypothetical protein
VLHRQFACQGTALDGLTCRTGKIDIWDTDAFGPIGARVGSVAAGFEARFEKSELAAEGIFAGDCFIATKPRGEAEGNHPCGDLAGPGESMSCPSDR